MAVAFLRRSTALSKSWLLAASAPSRASLFASGFFLACAWHTCEAQRARAAIKIKVKDLFIDFCWTLVLFRQFEARSVNSWLLVLQFQVCSGDGVFLVCIFGYG